MMPIITEDICAQCPRMRSIYLDFARSLGCGTTEANINVAFRDYLNKNPFDKNLQPCDKTIETAGELYGEKTSTTILKDSIPIEKLSSCEDGICKILEDSRSYLEHLESRKKELLK